MKRFLVTGAAGFIGYHLCNLLSGKGYKVVGKAAPLKKGPLLDISESFAPYRLYNIGNNKPIALLEFVNILEGLIGKKAIIENQPMQPGDMFETYADIKDFTAVVGFAPKVDIRAGLKVFVDWYKSYYH